MTLSGDLAHNKVKREEEPFWGSAKIKQISDEGLVTITFNESLAVPANLTLVLNSSTMNVSLGISPERRQETDFNASLLNFTWQAVSFTERKLTI